MNTAGCDSEQTRGEHPTGPRTAESASEGQQRRVKKLLETVFAVRSEFFWVMSLVETLVWTVVQFLTLAVEYNTLTRGPLASDITFSMSVLPSLVCLEEK